MAVKFTGTQNVLGFLQFHRRPSMTTDKHTCSHCQHHVFNCICPNAAWFKSLWEKYEILRNIL